MSKRRTVTWSVFAGSALCGVALLGWLTATMLRLEQAEAQARAHAAHEIAVGAALWQMDAWLLPLLTAEAQRPATDYQAFNPVQDAYTNMLSKLSPGEVVTPSPLLAFRSPYFRLHFQIDGDGKVTSPQVPEGNARDVAQSQVEGLQFDAQGALLERLKRVLSPSMLLERCSVGAAALPEAQILQQQEAGDGQARGWTANYNQRAQVTKQARQNDGSNLSSAGTFAKDSAPPTDNPLVPLWFDDPAGGDGLAFVRRLALGGRTVYQGVVADWEALKGGMIAQIAEPALALGARLVRIDRPDVREQPHLLTVLPASLETAPPPIAVDAWTPARSLLAIAWLALLGTAAVAAFTLHAALAFGDRRARFASAVTHELRTPLTTFRMYSEMLAKGMVQDPARQKQYLETLQSESDRLARLVENVLGYARIEDGRFTARIETIALGDLVARIRPVLERRAADADFALAIEVRDGDTKLDVDSDAVGQILFNLVDNACKYGRPPLALSVGADATHVRLSLRDHGAGVPAQYRARIFAAFDRGARQPGDNEIPGVGLGLALARSLARDLGGDLTLADAEAGACFVLALQQTRVRHQSPP